MKKIMFYIIFFIVITIFIVFLFFFVGSPPQAKEIIFGVTFSQKHAKDLGISWKETYLALLDDLRAKNLRIITHWDLVEPGEGEYNFDDLDWQIAEAEKRGAKTLLIIGMKVPRWPECHIPEWAKNLEKSQQQERILALLEKFVLRYRDSSSIERWQVENESFFPFGQCPWVDREFLKKEVNLVKSLDPQKRPIVLTESGEFTPWLLSAKFGDIVGTTLYRKVWFTYPSFLQKILGRFHQTGVYVKYPLRPVFYWRKAQIVKKIANKEVIVAELQAEPWGPKLLYDSPLKEQKKTMDLEQFKKNIEFAKRTGLKEFYLWGAEGWYWLKVKQNDPRIWDEAKKLFIQ